MSDRTHKLNRKMLTELKTESYLLIDLYRTKRVFATKTITFW